MTTFLRIVAAIATGVIIGLASLWGDYLLAAGLTAVYVFAGTKSD